MSIRFASFLLILLVVLAADGTPASAHPFHFSFAEGEWNADSQRLEVALRLEPHDLEAALRRPARAAVRLEDPAAEKHLQAYLKEAVQFKTASDKPVELQWIGAEVKIKAVWLYFEVPLPQGLEGVSITNTLLLEQLPNQVNVMALKQGKKVAALHFSAKQATHQVKLRENMPEPAASDMPE